MIKLFSPSLVFLGSVFLELLTLFFLRFIGIGWDYHTDAVTYIEKSSVVANSILNSDSFLSLINNGFFILVNFLNSNPTYVIAINILLFSITNYLIVKIMRPFRHKFYSTYEYLIILNPYRVYLGTTVLKDTLICFLLIFSFYIFNIKKFRSSLKGLKSRTKNIANNFLDFISSKLLFLLTTIILIIVAIRSVFYLTIFARFFDNPRKLRSLLLAILFVVFVNAYLGGNMLEAFDSKSLVNMDFREYGQVPNFASFGFLGTIMRTFIWPLLYCTGTFVLFSPSLELILISAGILFVFILQIKIRAVPFLMSSYFCFLFFAGFTSGFLPFGRYVLPAWLISSIVIYIKKSPNFKT